jgi:hypothetical protein
LGGGPSPWPAHEILGPPADTIARSMQPALMKKSMLNQAYAVALLVASM